MARKAKEGGIYLASKEKALYYKAKRGTPQAPRQRPSVKPPARAGYHALKDMGGSGLF